MSDYNPLDTVQANIQNITKERSIISADTLLDLIDNIIEYAQKYNEILSPSRNCAFFALPVSNDNLYITKLYRLAQTLKKSSEQNDATVKNVGKRLQMAFSEASENLKTIADNLEAISQQISNAEAEKKQLEGEKRKLEIENGKLIPILDEIEELNKQIGKLKDPSLQDAPEQKKRLELELGELTTFFDGYNSLLSEVESKRRDKAAKEKEQQKLSTEKQELNNWLEDYQKRSEEISDDLQSTMAQATLLRTAWNSISYCKEQQELWLQELQKSNAANNVPTNIQNFNDLSELIHAMLQLYTDIYSAMVKLSESAR